MEQREMKYFALIYYVVENFVEQRAPFRAEHLRLAQEAVQRGELLLAGALGEPAERALLIFYAPDKAVAERFAQNDPYVSNGLVARWEVQPWAVVIEHDHFAAKGGGD
jgi:uncharacterized protein YciI